MEGIIQDKRGSTVIKVILIQVNFIKIKIILAIIILILILQIKIIVDLILDVLDVMN